MADVNPVGPIYAAGDEIITKGGYKIAYLPDLHNDELQRAGKPPVYYWLPNTVRLARKDGDTGEDYRFRLIYFAGRRTEDTHVGVEGEQEVSGGLIGFSTIAAPPSAVLQEMHDELLNRCRGTSDKYWGWRTPAAPMIRSAPIVSNTTTVTNLSPNADGTVPTPTPTGGGSEPTPTGGGSQPAPDTGGGPPRARMNGRPRELGMGLPRVLVSPLTVPLERGYRGSNLDAWYFNLQGQGAGSVSPLVENAYSGLMGSLPAALLWAGFHGSSSPVTVWQNLMIKVWSPVCRIYIKGEWDKVQDHLSAAAKAGGLFWSADIKAEFNNMVMSGGIEAKIEVDTTLPNAAKLEEAMNKQKELLYQKFLEIAQKTIFDPAPFTEKPAEASGGFLGFGGGGALKLRRDKTHLKLEFDEKKEMAYLQPYPISGQLDGIHEHIAQDPSAEKRYFTRLILDDIDRKVRRVVKPVVNWPDPAQKWVGHPVSFVSVQVGYPNTEGELQWDGHIFQAQDGPDATWETSTLMKKESEVTNPPSGWKSDKTFVKRQLHFNEPPNETENPFVRIAVEKNVVDLDPGERGSLLNDINMEIRVDSVGMLNVGPIFLDVDLENSKQVVEVEFQAAGTKEDGTERAPVRFGWKFEDQIEPRYWMVFTGQPDFIPRYKYRVRVIVKGSIFTQGMEWMGAWQDASANGPIMVSVPTPEDEGVVMRSLWVPGTITARTDISGDGVAGVVTPPPVPTGAGSMASPPRPGGSGTPPGSVSSAPPRPRKKSEAEKEAIMREAGGWTSMPSTREWSSMGGSRSAPPTPRPVSGARSRY